MGTGTGTGSGSGTIMSTGTSMEQRFAIITQQRFSVIIERTIVCKQAWTTAISTFTGAKRTTIIIIRPIERR
jgi:hypothetical protein